MRKSAIRYHCAQIGGREKRIWCLLRNSFVRHRRHKALTLVLSAAQFKKFSDKERTVFPHHPPQSHGQKHSKKGYPDPVKRSRMRFPGNPTASSGHRGTRQQEFCLYHRNFSPERVFLGDRHSAKPGRNLVNRKPTSRIMNRIVKLQIKPCSQNRADIIAHKPNANKDNR